MMTKLFPSFGDATIKEHRLIYDGPETPKAEPGLAEGMKKGVETDKEVVKKGEAKAKEADKGAVEVGTKLHSAVDAHFKEEIEEKLSEKIGPEKTKELKEDLRGEKMAPGERGHVKNELHMRELEKLANAPKDSWGPIAGYGKTDGRYVYMYKFDSAKNTLYAYSPVGMQALDAKTGVWKFLKPEEQHPKDVMETYETMMGTERTGKGLNYDAAGRIGYDMNNLMEEGFLKRDDKSAVSFDAFDKAHPEAWSTAQNKAVYDRFILGKTSKEVAAVKPEAESAATTEPKREEPKNEAEKPTEFDTNAVVPNFEMPEGTATDLKDKVIEPAKGVRMWGMNKNVFLRFDSERWNVGVEAPALGQGTVIKEKLGDNTVYRTMDNGKITGALEIGDKEIKLIEYKEGGEPKQPLVIQKIK